MSVPNITTLTSAYVGTISARGGSLINQTPDAGGTTGQTTTFNFLGVPSGGIITTPATLAQLTVQRPASQSAAASFGQLTLSTNNGSGSILPVFSASISGFINNVTFFNNTYDTTSGASFFKNGGVTALQLNAGTATFNNQVSMPAISLTGASNQINVTNTLGVVVGAISVASLTSGGALTLLGATPIIDSTNAWTLKQGGTSYMTLGSSQVALSTTAQLYVPSSLLVAGADSATKFVIQDGSSVTVLTVDTVADKVIAAALQISSLGAGLLTSDVSGNVSVSSGGLTFNNTTLTGTTSFTGSLIQSNSSAVTFTVAPSAAGLTLTGATPVINTAGTSIALSVGGTSYATLSSANLALTNALAISGAASATKLQVLNATSAAVATVDTSANKLIANQAFQIASLGAGILITDASGNVSTESATGLTFTNTTLAGTTTATGTVAVNGTISSTKFVVNNATPAAVLTVDTSANKVIANQAFQIASLGAGTLITDASGNVSVSSGGFSFNNTTLTGTTTVTGTVAQNGTVSVTKFQILNATPAAVFTVDTSGNKVIANQGFQIASLGAGVLSSDSSGNVSSSSTGLTLSGTTLAGATSVTGTVSQTGTASATKFQILNTTPAAVFTVDTSASKVIANQAFQIASLGAGVLSSDASGNVSSSSTGLTLTNTTLAGTTTASGTASATKLQVLNATSAAVMTVDTSANKLVANQGFQIASLGAGVLVTDGSGNASATSTLNAITLTGANSITGTETISGTVSSTKFVVQNATPAAVLTVDTSGNKVVANQGFQIASLSAGTLITDGSGNVSASTGGLSFNNTTLTGTTTVTGTIAQNGTVSATKFQILNATPAAVFTVDTSANKVIANQAFQIATLGAGILSADSSGNVSSSSTGLTLTGTTLASTTTVTGTIVANGTNNASKLQVVNNSSAVAFNVDTTANKVTAAAIQISSLTAGVLQSDGSGNVSSSSTLTAVTLAGANSLTGSLTQSGSGAVTFTVAPSMSGATLTATSSLINTTGTSLALQVGGATYVTYGSNSTTFGGSTSTTKFVINNNNATPAAVLTVDTTNNKVVVNQNLQIASLGAGTLVTDASGNVSVSGGGLSFNNTTLTGATTITGTVAQNGAANVAKFQIVNATPVPVFTVDTSNNKAVANIGFQIASLGAGNLVSDSSGNVSVSNTGLTFTTTTLAGTTTVTGTVAQNGTASTTKFQILNATPTAVFTVDTSGNKVVANQGFQIASLGAGNLVSDASGNVSVSNTGLTFTNTTLAGTTSATGTFSSQSLSDNGTTIATTQPISLTATSPSASSVTLYTALNPANSAPALHLYTAASLGFGDLFIAPQKINSTTAQVDYDAPGTAGGVTVTHSFKQGIVVQAGGLAVTGTITANNTAVFVGTGGNLTLQNSTALGSINALRINGTSNTPALAIAPNYKGSTLTANFVTYNVESGTTHYFNNAVEIGGAITLDTFTSGTPGWHTSNNGLQTASPTTQFVVAFDPANPNTQISTSNLYGVDIMISPIILQTLTGNPTLIMQLVSSCSPVTVISTAAYSGSASVANSQAGTVTQTNVTGATSWPVFNIGLSSPTGIRLAINVRITWPFQGGGASVPALLTAQTMAFGQFGNGNGTQTSGFYFSEATPSAIPTACGIAISISGTGTFSTTENPIAVVTPLRA